MFICRLRINKTIYFVITAKRLLLNPTSKNGFFFFFLSFSLSLSLSLSIYISLSLCLFVSVFFSHWLSPYTISACFSVWYFLSLSVSLFSLSYLCLSVSVTFFLSLFYILPMSVCLCYFHYLSSSFLPFVIKAHLRFIACPSRTGINLLTIIFNLLEIGQKARSVLSKNKLCFCSKTHLSNRFALSCHSAFSSVCNSRDFQENTLRARSEHRIKSTKL